MPRELTDYEAGTVQESLLEFEQMQTWRNTFAGQWEEVSELIRPNDRNTFFYGNFNWPGQKKTDRQVDATGMMANGRFGAICDSLLTPRNSLWHGLKADNPYLMKQRGVRLWYEAVVRALFHYRYQWESNFTSQNQSNYQVLGAYGTMAMAVDEFDYTQQSEPTPGLRYRSIPLGQIYFRENHQGLLDGFCWWHKRTAQQIMQIAGPEYFPEVLRPALEKKSPMLFNLLHRVVPNLALERGRLGARGKPFSSFLLSMEGKCLLRAEGGYRRLPVIGSRYDQAPDEIYGRGPAMAVLPALKTLNAEKRTFLKQGHRITDPVLFTNDDGVVDASLRPGALNKGGVNADGKLMVAALPTGTLAMNKEMMEEERNLINDAFLVSLFQIMTESPQMTATEVIERTNEKGILIAPTVGRQQSEYLGPLIMREIDVLQSQHLLPPMPAVMHEARGQFRHQIEYTSPLAKAMKAQEAAGFVRTVETVKELVNITGDPSLLDPFDFDVATPEIAQIQSVPERWMADDAKIAQKRKARAQQQEQQAKIQAMPAQAAMLKAQAAAQKNGPGQLPAQGGPPLAQQLGG